MLTRADLSVQKAAAVVGEVEIERTAAHIQIAYIAAVVIFLMELGVGNAAVSAAHIDLAVSRQSVEIILA